MIPGHIFNVSWTETTPRCRSAKEFLDRWIERPDHFPAGTYPVRVMARPSQWVSAGPCMSRLEVAAPIAERVANSFEEAMQTMAALYYQTQSDTRRILIYCEPFSPRPQTQDPK